METDLFGMLLDLAPLTPEPDGNTDMTGFVVLLIALIIVLILSFVFCVKEVKKAKKTKKPQINEQQNNKDEYV